MAKRLQHPEGLRGAEDTKVEDPDTGDLPAGATREADGAARRDAPAAAGAGGASAPGAGAQHRSGRRRRKRRRGRKVFAAGHGGPAGVGASRGDVALGIAPGASDDPPPASGPGGGVSAPAGPPADAAPAYLDRHGDAGDPGRVDGVAAPAIAEADAARAQRSYGSIRESLGRAGDHSAYAALDLGTNNCRLLVAVPGRPGQFRVIDAFSRIVRLGEGLSASGRLGEAAMDRAVQALSICADKLATRPGARRRLIATEACRAAANGEEFLARVENETGLTLEIIDRQTEARLAVSGCGSLVERGTDAVVLFDIGGGSSEIALVDVSRRRSPHLADHIAAWTSLPVGVVSLAERFGGREVTRETFAAMVGEVRSMIDGFAGRGALAGLASGPRFHLLGTSGTVTTLAGVHLDLARYDRRRVDGLWMSSGEVDAMVERLLGWDFAARVANPCIGADRADLVLAGCAILEAIRQVWPAPRLRVADRGLREGILTELMAGDGVWARGSRHPVQRR
ncbi:MAG: Ppx/GppA family phosphatase [Rhizobiaceae bacterium]|nr:Ppx/GppA family phosphatase [Rhizobiaceae bacterium]